MRKVIVSNLISMDGFMSGPNGEIDWFVSTVDKEFEEYSVDLINSVDTMLFGRVTYELMAAYWPNATFDTDDPRIIHAMNSFPKIVFSKKLEKVEWNNSKLVKGDIIEEVTKLKHQDGKDMVIFGSGSFVSALANGGLIDDYKIIVCPVILGSGKGLFAGVNNRINLKLIDKRVFGNSSLVLLHYQTVNKAG